MRGRVLQLVVAFGLAACAGDVVERNAEQELRTNFEIRPAGEGQATIVLWGPLADEASMLLSRAMPYPHHDRIALDDLTLVRFPFTFDLPWQSPFEDVLCIERPYPGTTECRSLEQGPDIASPVEVTVPKGESSVTRPGFETMNTALAFLLFDSLERIAAASPQGGVERLGPDHYRSATRAFECGHTADSSIRCTIADLSEPVERVTALETLAPRQSYPYQAGQPGAFGLTEIGLAGPLAGDVMQLFPTAALEVDGYKVQMTGSDRGRVLCLTRADDSKQCRFVLEAPPVETLAMGQGPSGSVRLQGPAASTLHRLLEARAVYDPRFNAGAGRYVFNSLECMPVATNASGSEAAVTHACRFTLPL